MLIRPRSAFSYDWSKGYTGAVPTNKTQVMLTSSVGLRETLRQTGRNIAAGIIASLSSHEIICRFVYFFFGLISSGKTW
jgi:hypothetical protein